MRLLEVLEELSKGHVGDAVRRRIQEFREMRKKGPEEWFSELSFCILTANATARLGVRIQKELGPNGFLELAEEELAGRLRDLGHRFYRTRARFIVENRRLYPWFREVVLGFGTGQRARPWLVENVRGFGMKEASHFLRNVGFLDVAIIDRHIMRVLDEMGLYPRPRSLTRRRYIEMENLLRGIARELHMELGELDLYLWYLETGKVLK